MDHDRETARPAREEGRADTGAAGSMGSGAGEFGISESTGTPGSDSGRPAPADVRVSAGAYDRRFTSQEEGTADRLTDTLHEGGERISESIEEGKGRIQNALDSSRNRVADQLERAGHRVEDRARTMEDAGGVQRRAGQVVRRTSEALDTSADYIRTHDTSEMRDDLEHAIRERPLMSVGMALGAGFLLARIMRD